MSYNLKVKRTLSEKSRKGCCKKAELYGYLLCGKLFSEEEIIISEIDADLMRPYISLLSSWLGYDVRITKNGRIFSSVMTGKDARRVFAKLGVSQPLTVEYGGLLRSECCRAAFLRGMFIACGVVSDPQQRYALEFTYDKSETADSCRDFLVNCGYEPGFLSRRGKLVLYIKSADSIKDFLSTVGAVEFMFDYANAGIIKELQNNVNRVVNCESANIDKSVKALTEQRALIRELKERGYEGLDSQQIAIAEARLTSENISLEALGREMNPPMSKTTIFRKLKKICSIAAEICGGKGEEYK